MIALASCMASAWFDRLFVFVRHGDERCAFHGTACCFSCDASTFGVCGSAYSAQPDTQIRQAEFSTIVFFVVFAVLTLLISFWRPGVQRVRRIFTAGTRSHQARMACHCGRLYVGRRFLGLSGAIYASGLDECSCASYLASCLSFCFCREPLRRLGSIRSQTC